MTSILLMLASLPAAGQEPTIEEKESKTIRFTKIFFDKTNTIPFPKDFGIPINQQIVAIEEEGEA